MKDPDIDKDEFELWLAHPITKRVRALLGDQIIKVDAHWMGLLEYAPSELEAARIRLNERKAVLQDILDITEEDLNGEQIGPGGP